MRPYYADSAHYDRWRDDQLAPGPDAPFEPGPLPARYFNRRAPSTPARGRTANHVEPGAVRESAALSDGTTPPPPLGAARPPFD